MAAFVDDDEDEGLSVVLPTTPGTVDKVNVAMQSSPEEYADSTQVISYFHWHNYIITGCITFIAPCQSVQWSLNKNVLPIPVSIFYVFSICVTAVFPFTLIIALSHKTLVR